MGMVCKDLQLAATLTLSARLKPAATLGLSTAWPTAFHPSAFGLQHSSFSPFPLQNVKEQARERRTRCTLPRLGGNAIFIFLPEFTVSPNTQNRRGEEFPPIAACRVLRFSRILVGYLRRARTEKRRENGRGK
jgi:hypothetical protein